MKKTIDAIYDACGCLWGTLLAILCIALVLAFIFGIYCLEGWIFMLMWNWLAVDLLGAKVLGYWVCVGICFVLHFLGRIIFGRVQVKTKS